MATPDARPLLKWAGGKRQLLPDIRRFYPPTFNGYLEPFVGSAAVFLDLHNRGALAGRRVRLLDINPDLIGCYRVVRDATEQVITHLQALADEHRRSGKDHYYDVRDRRFNPARRRLATHRVEAEGGYTAELAAMLIYLNRTGYNGLFRLNADGGFNVPAGRYANPTICDPENVRRVADALGAPGVRLEVATFDRVRQLARSGDFIYLDPPYAPVSRTSSFTAYTAGGFTLDGQRRLQRLVLALAERGCRVLLSNSTAPVIAALYDGNDEAGRVGLTAHTVHARRAINSRAGARGRVPEFLISNVEPAPDAG